MTQPIYRWAIAQGQLKLFSENETYTLILKKNDKTKVNVVGPDFKMEADKVQQFCKSHFPILTQQRDNSWIAEFNPLAVPGKILNEEAHQIKKGMGAFSFAFNMLEQEQMIEFDDTAPSYRQVTMGLNMQAKCSNDVCEAFKKVVYIPKGIGDFNIGQLKNKALCQACNQKISSNLVNNLGFWNCQYQVEGKRADTEEEIAKNGTAEAARFTTFKPGDDVAWEYLQITTSKPKQELREKEIDQLTASKPEQEADQSPKTKRSCEIV